MQTECSNNFGTVKHKKAEIKYTQRELQNMIKESKRRA